MALTPQRRQLLWRVAPLPFGVIAVGLLFAMLGTGITAIVVAADTANDPPRPYYFLGVAVGTSLMCSLFTSLAIMTAVTSARRLKEIREGKQRLRSQRSKCMLQKAAEGRSDGTSTDQFLSTDEEDDPNEDDQPDDARIIITIDVVGKKERQPTKLRELTLGANVAVFAAFQCTYSAILCVFCAITIANHHQHVTTQSRIAFFLADVFAGILAPILVVAAGILASVMLQFVTWGRLDAHQLIHTLIPCITFVQGSKYKYWVISDTFYYRLKLKEGAHSRPHCFHACDKTVPTWCLTIIISLSFIAAAAYFASTSIATRESVPNCDSISGDVASYTCHQIKSGDYVNCSSPNVSTSFPGGLHCFRFLQFGSDANPMDNLVQAVVLYLVSINLFGQIFRVVKVLLHIKHTKLWGVLIFITGILLFVLSSGLLIWGLLVVLKFNFLTLLQLVLFSVYVTVTGVLLLWSKWWESVDTESVKEVVLEPIMISSPHDWRRHSLKKEPSHLPDTEKQLPEDDSAFESSLQPMVVVSAQVQTSSENHNAAQDTTSEIIPETGVKNLAVTLPATSFQCKAGGLRCMELMEREPQENDLRNLSQTQTHTSDPSSATEAYR